jgi:hypothetical protein
MTVRSVVDAFSIPGCYEDNTRFSSWKIVVEEKLWAVRIVKED